MDRRLFEQLVLKPKKIEPTVVYKAERSLAEAAKPVVWYYIAYNGSKKYMASAEQDVTTGKWEAIQDYFETEDKAVAAGYKHMKELDHDGELVDNNDNPIDIDNITIKARSIPISKVSKDDLKSSGLDHLI